MGLSISLPPTSHIDTIKRSLNPSIRLPRGADDSEDEDEDFEDEPADEYEEIVRFNPAVILLLY